MSEVITSPDQDFIPVDEVRAIQALAMGSLSKQARTRLDDEKMSGFVLYDNPVPSELIGTSAVDVFMGVVSRKMEYDYWQFTVSFLTMMNSDELRHSNTRELYRFNWNNQGRCVGTKILTDNYHPIVNTRYDTERGLIDTVQPHIKSWWYGLHDNDCAQLADRMLAVAEATRLTKAKKFGADWSRL